MVKIVTINQLSYIKLGVNDCHNLCINSCRETIAHTFVTTSVQDQIERYNEDDGVKHRWDVLQSSYQCCGGGPRGHRDYTNREGRLIEGT